MKRPSFLLLLTAIALISAGCSVTSTDAIVKRELDVRLPRAFGIAERGSTVIADSVDNDLLADLVIDYINLYRAKYNLTRLWPEQHAMYAARWMADWQSRRSVVTHVTDVPGMSIFPERYRRLGGESYSRGVENAGWYVLYDSDSSRNMTYDEMARRIVDGWINSPGHRKNLLASMGPEDGTVGIGIARGVYEGFDGIFSTMNAFFPWPDHSEIFNNRPPLARGISASPRGQ